MSKTNVIVLTRIKSSRRDLRLFGFDEIGSQNYQLWDISRVTSQITHDWEFKNLARKSKRIKKICSKRDIESETEKIKNSENHFVLDKDRLSRNRKKVGKLEERLSEYGSLSERYGKIHPIRNKNRDTKNLINSYYKYIKRVLGNETKRRKRKKSEYVFVPTKWDMGKVDRVGIGTKVEKLHTEEYDSYLISKNNKEELKKRGAVFIDQALPYHIDLKNKYGSEWLKDVNYYTEVEKFLEEVEKYTTMEKGEISISAHPKTRTEKIEKFFRGRTIRKNRTPEMVLNSEIVLTHFSTASLYAVMADKKTCFFSVESILDTEENEHIRDMANMFGRKVNTKSKNKKIDIGKNKKRYNNIKKRLIKAAGTPNVNSWLHIYNTLTK